MADRLPAIGQSFDDEPHSGYVPVREPKLIDRFTMLPIGQYEDGSLTLAWPQMLVDIGNSFARSLVAQEGRPVFDDGGQYVSGATMEPLDGLNVASIPALGTFGAGAAGLTAERAAPTAARMFANDANASAPSIALNAVDELPPIRAYHGTNARFSTFDPSMTDEAGFHFGSKDQAASREIAKNGLFSLPWPLGKGWRTIPVDIYPNKIADLTADPVKATGYSLAKRLVDDGIAPDSLLREATRQHVKGDKAGSTSTVRDWLVDNGYDLVRYPNNYEGGGPSYLALGTGNVKHARSGKTLFANPETASYPSLLLNSEDGQHRSFIDDLPRISTRDE